MRLFARGLDHGRETSQAAIADQAHCNGLGTRSVPKRNACRLDFRYILPVHQQRPLTWFNINCNPANFLVQRNKPRAGADYYAVHESRNSPPLFNRLPGEGNKEETHQPPCTSRARPRDSFCKCPGQQQVQRVGPTANRMIPGHHVLQHL